MIDLIHINGQICKNCNEINAADIIIALMVFFLILLLTKIVKYFKSQKIDDK
jgi:hypothetical protein